MTLSNILLVISAILTGLVAGLFYSWTVSVTPGLAKLPDREYILAFQSMNRAILNPMFFLSFMGAAILLPVTAFVQFRTGLSLRFWLLAGATAFYIIGVLVVTLAGNVPMNEALDAFNVNGATEEALKTRRLVFESKWNGLNTIRTICSTISLLLVILACMNAPKFVSSPGETGN